MKKSIIVISYCFLLLAHLRVSGQNHVYNKDSLDVIALQDVPPKSPGIATAIIDNGKVVYKQYGGYANLSDSTLINEYTLFNIASNGKQFTALAVLLLVDQGKVSLTDDIRLYLPNVFKDIEQNITIDQLLHHTSGIRDFYDLLSLQRKTWWKLSYTNSDVLRLLEDQRELNFKPGTQYLYSNSNYVLLALIIEQVSGLTFVNFTRQMFDQLGMNNTFFVDDAKSLNGPIAKSYFNFGTWTTYDWIWNACGDGNIFSTLSDQIQWEMIVQGKVSQIKPELIDLSQTLPNSSISNYGYGLEFGQYKGLTYRFHEGATGAWKATILRFPNDNRSYITMTNTGKSIPSMQTRQMVDITYNLESDEAYFLTKPKVIGAFVDQEQIVGLYSTTDGFLFQFLEKDGILFLRRDGRNDVELKRESANIFHQKFDPDFKQEFIVNAEGILEVTAYYINHAPYTLKKIQPIKGFNFEQLNGVYKNQELGVTISLNYLGGQEYDIRLGNDSIQKGLLLTTNEIKVGGYLLKISGNTFRLDGDRIKNVLFDKVSNLDRDQ
ncbi:serine hydrolase domain-containing protein [Penaeicola halotolerans]|uniref:serine hydrolase domain-containing protein n=1 Tax=Penaeicola halotolerans TaxID=2793196 RepID=UPI001CF81741|nr:serine hydrolase domain-containing protein [Penaeicola halotolerans]